MSPRILTLALLVGASGVLGAQMPGTAAKQAAKNVAAQASARATMTPESQEPAAKPAAQPAPVKQQGASSAPAKSPAQPAAKPAVATKGSAKAEPKGTAAAPPEPKAKKAKAKPLAGESGNAPVAKGAAAAAAAKPAVKDTVVPRVIMREAFTYDKGGRRDPFASLMATSDLRPTISDLRLTGILYDLSGRRPVAIMRDLITKAQYRVTNGMTLGRMRVAQIKPKVVVFSIEEFGLNRQDSLVLGDSTKVRTK